MPTPSSRETSVWAGTRLYEEIAEAGRNAGLGENRLAHATTSYRSWLDETGGADDGAEESDAAIR